MNEQMQIDPLLVIDELTREIGNKAKENAMLKAQVIQLTKELNELQTLEIK